ncbi:hypothetical protein [Nocardia gamkensis]|uniref:Resolvase/invertase-type recombinase catalytic domain-containing protein n=1 Tax=Nocardia gamkensis TaxID=352869 RepID=A0A7X6L0V2_9NOCA|nr:hypothetical protein [Nocardia gamkensis]NKY25637.1 hypothetical protein [Nocardia gamkensis]NQE66502.1 hypothetical protein [Nocardia gamkensis]
MKPKVVGYLRRDISGRRARRHEMEIRALAKASGFDLARTLVAGPTAPASLAALLTVVRRVGAVAVLTPTPNHVEFRADEIMAVCAAGGTDAIGTNISSGPATRLRAAFLGSVDAPKIE